MFEINVTVSAPAMEQAINCLAAALQNSSTGKCSCHNGSQAQQTQTTVAEQPTAASQAQAMASAQTQQPVTAASAQPMTAPQAQQPAMATPAQVMAAPQAQQPQTAAPAQQPQIQGTATQGVSLDAIINAGAGLVEKGKMAQVVALLGKYGVQAVNQLQPAQYDAFANELRTLGAQI